MPAEARFRMPGTRAGDLLGLIGFAVATAATALVGGLAVRDAGGTYDALEPPRWAPPGWLFGPVWAVLYVTIAVAGWLVWRRTGLTRTLIPYAVQLVFNAAWTPIFFGAHAYGLAAIDIVLLWCAIAATVVAFWRVHRSAAALLLPYWAWVTFAAALNLDIWWTNR